MVINVCAIIPEDDYVSSLLSSFRYITGPTAHRVSQDVDLLIAQMLIIIYKRSACFIRAKLPCLLESDGQHPWPGLPK